MTVDRRPVVLDPPEPVTVVIPLYERASLIGDALDSVATQTWPAVEVVVVDDGSTDGGGDVVADRASADPRVRLVRQANGGPSVARNTALAHTRTRLVTFLDSDDLMHPTRIEQQVRHLADHPDDDIVVCVEDVQLAPGVTMPPLLQAEIERTTEKLWYAMSMLLDRRWIDLVGGFDPSFRIGEDLDLMMRMRDAGARLGKLDDALVVRRIFGDNLVYDHGGSRQAMFRSLHRRLRDGSARRSPA